jgi:hypothetical protein
MKTRAHRLTPAERLRNRFWGKVNKDGPTIREELGPCWEWIGYRLPKGYGRLWGGRGNGYVYAHRVAWALTHGELEAAARQGDAIVLHKCDNPPCCNPEHLTVGSQADNVKDRDLKGRGRWPGSSGGGTGTGLRQFSDDDVVAMHALRLHGHTQADIGHRFGTGQPQVSNILSRKTYAHVPIPDAATLAGMASPGAAGATGPGKPRVLSLVLRLSGESGCAPQTIKSFLRGPHNVYPASARRILAAACRLGVSLTETQSEVA